MADERSTERATDDLGPRVRSFRVEVVRGPSSGSKASSRDGLLRVGAGAGNDLVLEDPRVSSHHLEIEALPEGGVRLKDLGSTNGTEVDGYRTGEIFLKTEARVALGASELWYAEEGPGSVIPLSEATSFGAALGTSPAMRRVFAVLERIAPTTATVLIEGESGTGKELLARAVHDHSPRKDRPYVVLDASATTPTLLESELFGHAKGAFTGAVKDRAGLFEAASGGTLFLDEIGELPAELQAKLLGVLERRTVRRVGTSEDRPIDVRVIAATNRDLREEVNEGRFRADLYHRLAVVRVLVPPLRQRPEDVLPIARRMLAELGKRYSVDPAAVLGEDALMKLTRLRWSGNVRELRNHLERTMAMAAGGVGSAAELEALTALASEAVPANPEVGDLSGTFKDAKARHNAVFERAYLSALLARHQGNLSAAAREADLSRLHLRTLARRYGIAAGEDK